MSVKIMGLVWDLDLPQNLKFVLLAYADHSDHSGRNIFPAVASIAKKTGYSERSVQRITRELESLGYLIADGGQDGGSGITARWYIPKNGDKLTPFKKGDNLSERVTFATKKGDTAMSPESSLTIKSTVNNDESVKPEPETEFEPPKFEGPRKAARAFESAISQIKREMPAGAFEKWVGGCWLADYDPDDGIFTVGAHGQLARDWLDSRISSMMGRYLTGAMGAAVDVEFVAVG